MKKLILLTFLSLGTFSCEKKKLEYHNLLNKHIDDAEVQKYLAELGSDYKYEVYYETVQEYIYESKGIELSFSEFDTLKAIAFRNNRNFSPETQLPFRLKMSMTKKEVEELIGEPERRNRNATYYTEKDITIVYKTEDTNNPNNGIRSIMVEDGYNY